MRNLIVLFSFTLFLFACQSDSGSSGQEQNQEAVTSENGETYPAPYFIIENYQDSLGNPKSTINLNVSNKKLKIADVTGSEKIESKDYEQYQIPKEAIDACGGWWAGAGDYFYLVSNGDDNYTVMQGEMHEEKETNNYDYKMVMNLSNKLIPRAKE